MLLPRKVKYRKSQKGRRRNTGIATQKNTLSFGTFGLKTLEYGQITSRQIEAARRAMTRFIKRGGTIWIRIFPDKSVTKKGSEIPMGGGKGGVDHYVAVVRAGTMLFEIDGVSKGVAMEAMHLAASKLPVSTRFIDKEDIRV